MFQIKNSKAASVMMAAFFVSGCQPKTEFFFEISGDDPIIFQHLFWFLRRAETFLPFMLITVLLITLLFRRVSKRFAAFTQKPLAFKFTIPRLWLYSGSTFFLLNFSISYVWSLLTSKFSLAERHFLSDDYNVSAHIHYTLFFSSAFLLFTILYWCLSRYLKYAYHQTLAVFQFLLFVLGVVLMLFPQFALMASGSPHRYIETPESFELWYKIANLGVVFCLISAAAFILVVIEALVKKRLIGDRNAEKNGKRNEP